MIGGLVIMAIASTILVAEKSGTPHAVPVSASTAAPPAITLSARDVSVVAQVYEPGEDSGWHAHAGIYAVAVISGALTVFGADCDPQVVEAGRPYVGGQTAHLVRNETSAPAVTTVSYLGPSNPGDSTRRVEAPAGCTLSVGAAAGR